jgi:hypothetical protein
VSEWLIVVYRQFRNFSAISWRELVNFQWDDDEVCFVLNQHAELDFYCASSLKQQFTGRYITPFRHIILIPSQPVFALSPKCCVLSGEATNTNFIVLVWPDQGSHPQSTAPEASMLTITPPMRLTNIRRNVRRNSVTICFFIINYRAFNIFQVYQVLHHLQVVLFIKIWTIFTNILYNTL